MEVAAHDLGLQQQRSPPMLTPTAADTVVQHDGQPSAHERGEGQHKSTSRCHMIIGGILLAVPSAFLVPRWLQQDKSKIAITGDIIAVIFSTLYVTAIFSMSLLIHKARTGQLTHVASPDASKLDIRFTKGSVLVFGLITVAFDLLQMSRICECMPSYYRYNCAGEGSIYLVYHVLKNLFIILQTTLIILYYNASFTSNSWIRVTAIISIPMNLLIYLYTFTLEAGQIGSEVYLVPETCNTPAATNVTTDPCVSRNRTRIDEIIHSTEFIHFPILMEFTLTMNGLIGALVGDMTDESVSGGDSDQQPGVGENVVAKGRADQQQQDVSEEGRNTEQGRSINCETESVDVSTSRGAEYPVQGYTRIGIRRKIVHTLNSKWGRISLHMLSSTIILITSLLIFTYIGVIRKASSNHHNVKYSDITIYNYLWVPLDLHILIYSSFGVLCLKLIKPAEKTGHSSSHTHPFEATVELLTILSIIILLVFNVLAASSYIKYQPQNDSVITKLAVSILIESAFHSVGILALLYFLTLLHHSDIQPARVTTLTSEQRCALFWVNKIKLQLALITFLYYICYFFELHEHSIQPIQEYYYDTSDSKSWHIMSYVVYPFCIYFFFHTSKYLLVSYLQAMATVTDCCNSYCPQQEQEHPLEDEHVLV